MICLNVKLGGEKEREKEKPTRQNGLVAGFNVDTPGTFFKFNPLSIHFASA